MFFISKSHFHNRASTGPKSKMEKPVIRERNHTWTSTESLTDGLAEGGKTRQYILTRPGDTIKENNKIQVTIIMRPQDEEEDREGLN